MSFTFLICQMKMLVPFSQDYGKDLRKVSYVAVLSKETVPILHAILLNNNDYFLSINSWLSLDSISCSINVIFLFQDPIQATTLHLVVMFSAAFSDMLQFFSVFSCFSWLLRILRSTGQIPCGMGLSVIFHMINWDYVLERAPQRWSALLIPSYNQRHVLPHDLTGDVNLHHLVTVVFAKFLHTCYVSLPTLSRLWNWVTKSNYSWDRGRLSSASYIYYL